MASGVTFWQLPEEEEVFFRYLMQKDSVQAFPLMEAVADPRLIRAAPIEQFLGRKSDIRLYITPQEYGSCPIRLAGSPAAFYGTGSWTTPFSGRPRL